MMRVAPLTSFRAPKGWTNLNKGAFAFMPNI